MHNENRFLPWYMTQKKEKEKRRGEFAGLSQSLPSLVAATGPASGSVIHSYQFAFCCIFFSLVFPFPDTCYITVQASEKRQRPFFLQIHCRGL